MPFEPYRIHLSDGTRHDVRHPEMLAIGVRTSRLFIYSAELPELIDSEIRIDNLHITKTVPMQAVDSR